MFTYLDSAPCSGIRKNSAASNRNSREFRYTVMADSTQTRLLVATSVDDLDAYTRFAVQMILARFPVWLPFGVVRPGKDGCSAEFEIPCPSTAVERGLWLSTANNELTVGFHTHHAHFTGYDNPYKPEAVSAGLDQAAAYIEDRCGVVSWYEIQRLVGTASVKLPLARPLFKMLNATGNHATLRSWSGRSDSEDRLIEPDSEV
jgi:hypothetical protein